MVVTAGTSVRMLAAAVRTAAGGIARELRASAARRPGSAYGARALRAVAT